MLGKIWHGSQAGHLCVLTLDLLTHLAHLFALTDQNEHPQPLMETAGTFMGHF